MKKNIIEIVWWGALILVMITVPIICFMYSPWNKVGENRVISLTALGEQGVWTTEEINASNYWDKKYRPAELHLKKDETITLRLTSADVTHSFYVPDLNIGPIEVEGGHFYEIKVKPEITGKFKYYCTIVCGHCHYYMQGWIYVEDEKPMKFNDEITDLTCHHPTETNIDLNSIVNKGKLLYESKGCITCHGEGGKGQVKNPNYIKAFVPDLNTMADKLKLAWEEDAQVILELLGTGVDLQAISEDEPFRGYGRFLAQFESMITKMKDGAVNLQRSDSLQGYPPLFMPSWEHHLSNEEMNSIVAYFINEYEWDDF